MFEFVGVDPGFSHPPLLRRAPQDRPQDAGDPVGDAVRADPGDGSRAGWSLATFWRVVDNLFPFRRTIKVPDVREALSPEALRSLREDAERLRELTGREFATWSIFQV